MIKLIILIAILSLAVIAGPFTFRTVYYFKHNKKIHKNSCGSLFLVAAS